jgi:class 3 adenylate cyclase
VPELVVLNGVAAGTVFVLGDVPAVIGRSPEAHLQIGDPWISSMHAMFERRDDGVWVVDLDSRNGTFVGDDRVGESPVPDGAVVRFGRTDVRFAVRQASASEVARVRAAAAREDTPVSAARHEAVRTDGTMSTRIPLARDRTEDPYALAPRPATVLRMALDAAGLESVPDASERLRTALDAAARAALEEGGAVARLAGVGVLALFGLAGASPEDALAALRAARTARRAVHAEQGLDLRAAIESGPVLAGNAAGGAGFELAVLGPAAERAERLLALARQGEIVAGPGAGPAAGLQRAGLVRAGDAEIELFREG